MTARAHVAAYYVNCPACDQPITDPKTESYLIGRDSVDALAAQTRLIGAPVGTARCFDCGATFRLPAAVLRLA